MVFQVDHGAWVWYAQHHGALVVQVAAASASGASSAGEYVGGGQKYLEMARGLMVELPGKVIGDTVNPAVQKVPSLTAGLCPRLVTNKHCRSCMPAYTSPAPFASCL